MFDQDNLYQAVPGSGKFKFGDWTVELSKMGAYLGVLLAGSFLETFFNFANEMLVNSPLPEDWQKPLIVVLGLSAAAVKRWAFPTKPSFKKVP